MTLNATPGASTADSFLAVAGADALAGADLGPEVDAWLAAATATKEKALKRATREINDYLRSGWPIYDPATQRISGLIFPRSIDVDASGNPLIPEGIVRATYQQAIYVLSNADVIAAASSRQAQGMQSGSEPNVSWSRSPDEGSNVLSPLALHYLAGYQVANQVTSAHAVHTVRVGSGFRAW